MPNEQTKLKPVPDEEPRAEAPGVETREDGPRQDTRRDFLSTTASLTMAGGLLAGYGAFAGIAGRFVYPTRGPDTAWVVVTDLGHIKEGDSFVFRMPSGAGATITRRGEQGDVSDFLALSSTCPHLGCQVHWEAQHNRFFCPCHNGTFDPSGTATGGPPAQAGQALKRYPLKVEGGLLFIEVPVQEMAFVPSNLNRGTHKG